MSNASSLSGHCTHTRPSRSMPMAVDFYDRRAEPEFLQCIHPIRMPHRNTMLITSVGRFSCTGDPIPASVFSS